MGLHGGGSALDGLGGKGQVAVLLRDHLDLHIQAVFLEDACLVGQRERRKARPAGHAQHDFGVLRLRGRGHSQDTSSGRRQRCHLYNRSSHHLLLFEKRVRRRPRVARTPQQHRAMMTLRKHLSIQGNHQRTTAKWVRTEQQERGQPKQKTMPSGLESAMLYI